MKSNLFDEIVKALDTVKVEDFKEITKEEYNEKIYLPHNPISGTVYSGVNKMIFMIYQLFDVYKSSQYATFKQIKNAGGILKKGAKHSKVFYYSLFYVNGKSKINHRKWLSLSEKEQDKYKSYKVLKYFQVFNFDNITNIDEMDFERIEDLDITIKVNEDIEDFIKNTDAKIEYKKTESPCYIPSLDKIVMHPHNAYKEDIDLYAVLFHELVHWSGNKKRLNRDSLNAPNSNKKMYAIEEMVAELGAILLYSKFDLYSRFRSSVFYIKIYFSKVNNDIEELKKAYLEAKKAEKFICKFSETEKNTLSVNVA